MKQKVCSAESCPVDELFVSGYICQLQIEGGLVQLKWKGSRSKPAKKRFFLARMKEFYKYRCFVKFASMSVNEYFEANRNLWNQRTAVHKDSVFYDLAGFKAGANVLTPIELNEIGDVKDKSLLHLQCHFGMDTMSFSRMGAKCVGVDLSDEAIKLAREINDELKLDAKFICCNVYDLLSENLSVAKAPPLEEFGEAGQFDIVFTSYGTVGWLPDLDPWAKVIAERLKPGGFFYMAEFHPVVWMFDDDFTHIKYYYDNKEIIVMEDQPTYTGDKNEITGKEYSWNHSISEVLNALINAGLKIEFFNEYTFSPYANFKNSVETEPGKWHIKGMEGKIPIVYSLRARK